MKSAFLSISLNFFGAGNKMKTHQSMLRSRISQSSHCTTGGSFTAHIDDGAVLFFFHEGQYSSHHAYGHREVYCNYSGKCGICEGIGGFERVHYSCYVGESVDFFAVWCQLRDLAAW